MAGLMADQFRVHMGMDFEVLARDTHGGLRTKLEQRAQALPGLEDLIPSLIDCVGIRNALCHALPCLHGLTYRRANGSYESFCDTHESSGHRRGPNR